MQISVDGSCFVQDGWRSGYAALVLYPGATEPERIVFEGVRDSTINRMELRACIAAMEWVRESRPRTTRVQVFSDSQYVIDTIPRAIGLHKNKWRNAHGRPLKNPDLWKDFVWARLKAGVRVDFGKVKRRSTQILKEADNAAKAAARSGTGIDRGHVKGKMGRPLTKGGVVTMFPAAGQELTIRVYHMSLVPKCDENYIRFEVYDSDSGKGGAKHFAYAAPEVGAQLHRQRVFRVLMNDAPKYPQVLRVLEEIPLPKRGKRPRPAKVDAATAAASS